MTDPIIRNFRPVVAALLAKIDPKLLSCSIAPLEDIRAAMEDAAFLQFEDFHGDELDPSMRPLALDWSASEASKSGAVTLRLQAFPRGSRIAVARVTRHVWVSLSAKGTRIEVLVP